jgi:glycosyltransferase involved in cell wall biosynthesis
VSAVLLSVEQLRRHVPGGIGTYAASLARGLAALPREERQDVELYAARLAGDGADGGDPLAALGLRLRTSRLPVRYLTKAWDLGLSRAARGYDLVHATSLAAPPPYGRPLVVTVHDLAWRATPEAFPRRGRRWHEVALRRALVRAQAFVVPSSTTAAALAEAGVATGRITVVPHGADHLPPPDAGATARRLRSLGVQGPYLLAVGTLEPRKNLPRLFAAYASARSSLPDPWPLVVVGAAGWGGSLAPVEGVILAGEADQTVLPGLYRGARCTAYVPLVEGFGLPVVESMAAGTPVVASDVPSAGGATREVDPLDVSSIAAGLLDAAIGGPHRDQLVALGSARAAALTWRASAAAHVEVWRRVLAGDVPR